MNQDCELQMTQTDNVENDHSDVQQSYHAVHLTLLSPKTVRSDPELDAGPDACYTVVNATLGTTQQDCMQTFQKIGKNSAMLGDHTPITN